MKSDTPDELFVFPDFPSIGFPNRPDSLTPNLFLLSSEADSVFYTDISPPDHFVDVNEMYFSDDDLPF